MKGFSRIRALNQTKEGVASFKKRDLTKIVWDSSRFKELMGNAPTKSLTYSMSDVLNLRSTFRKYITKDLHFMHEKGIGLTLSYFNASRKTAESELDSHILALQHELLIWSYNSFRTTLSYILELNFGSDRKIEDSLAQKQWEKINGSEFLIVDLYENDIRDNKRSLFIRTLLRQRYGMELATIVVVHDIPFEELDDEMNDGLKYFLFDEDDTMRRVII